MSRSRALYHMVRADFLERVRRYSFLLTLGVSVYMGYAVYAGQIHVQLDKYRGVENSAWLGSVVGMVASVWLSLIGFYIVKNAIQRDRETRVGQILATTPIGKSFYTLGKTLSNLAVLAAMVLVLALAALAIQLARGADRHVDLVALFLPVLVFGLCAVAVTAALAVLFESLPVLRGGVGNVLYFFLWTTLITLSAVGMENAKANPGWRVFTDWTGLVSVMQQMGAQVRAIDPLYNGDAAFNVGPLNPATKTFLWAGFHWTPEMVLSRVALLGVAGLLGLLAAFFFDRFDPARAGWAWTKKQRRLRSAEAGGLLPAPMAAASSSGEQRELAPPSLTVAQLAPVLRAGNRTVPAMRMPALVLAELRLMLLGQKWWWWVVAAGLVVGCAASPLAAARSGVLPFAWLWPILVWSPMGVREAQWGTGAMIFSAPRAAPRQFLAVYAAGVLVAVLTGSGLAVHLLAAGDLAGLAAWAAGACFIPAMALALGAVSGTRKFFEALYTAWWYVGPLHHIRNLDFMGTTPASSTAAGYLVAAVLLLAAGYGWRKMRLAHA
ncbi:MAG: ABC transporter permease [Terracidiphilus sp.]